MAAMSVIGQRRLFHSGSRPGSGCEAGADLSDDGESCWRSDIDDSAIRMHIATKAEKERERERSAKA